jgi:hypothetical protein
MLSINPLYPPILGDFLELGDTPRPPAGSILHLFFGGLTIFSTIFGETAETVLINFLNAPILGDFLKLGGHPQTPDPDIIGVPLAL